MSNTSPDSSRVTVDGRFFRQGTEKFYVKGITYGPFAPNANGEMFPSPEQTDRDLRQVLELGANTLRLYYAPPGWFLDLADGLGLKLLIDIPWPKHLCFLDDHRTCEEARHAVREAVAACKGHPSVFAFSVVNEIPSDIVRWSGVRKIERFIDDLIDVARQTDRDCLCTFTSFPPTEFLQPNHVDFLCFNVYLHDRDAFEAYLARLQMLADSKPLMLGEFGIDSFREGEEHKCEILAWQIESTFRSGLAGMMIFSYTDDWFRGGYQIEDWAFGLTTRERQPKESFRVVQRQYRGAPYFPLNVTPKVSIVVASHNGARTLKDCLESLCRQRYADFEVILVDDGSTDNTREIASGYPEVRNIRQENKGLSAARNAGIRGATGEIVAFTDSDCRADEDWLYYLVNDLQRGGFTGIGGHNFLPPEDSAVAAAVLVSPGGPAHVMLNDRVAEHVPGCNMAFYRRALMEIEGFDGQFRKAGDDVDVCWRLQENGHAIGFSPSAFVWHHRRSTIRAYLKQQNGYGEAEALLTRKHPEYFSAYGGGIWRGRIYSSSGFGGALRQSIIYHGPFGSGLFQKLYAPEPSHPVALFTSLEYNVLVNLPLAILAIDHRILLPVACASLGCTWTVCAWAAAQSRLPAARKRWWSRPLVGVLHFLQPLVRGWSRYRWRMNLSTRPKVTSGRLAGLQNEDRWEPLDQLHFWSSNGAERFKFLGRLIACLEKDGWQVRTDSGWEEHDLQLSGNPWSTLTLISTTEELGAGKRSVRWRFNAAWSPRARAAVFLLAVVELVSICLFAASWPWVWMIPTVLPLFAWFCDDEKRNVQLLAVDLLRRTAEELGMVEVKRAHGRTTREPGVGAVPNEASPA